MQKRKSNKGQNISKFGTKESFDLLFDTIMEDIAMSNSGIDQIGQMASTAMTAAIALSKLVIENRLRNSDHMLDKDIYKIYGNSFRAVIQSASGIED
ncbi:hypothetical protein Megpolyxen_01069 [Candidatus Megaera polyxenophila]|nr:hypothetical protein Megpolyxen_01069 [Candidatus Megaera polyxenophila]